ncbi:aldehyde dehydrogenase family protein [Dactylosporangium aurantiacum]|uniref:aldehyde dehydrogenase (NAD(+)) n=1 Tax=Dactylosporangium aurantiacum TaxID=35754 RepID=A0A9Q9IBI2_9ACTN|nr:aldehyde dehydrogenase family protein [Dactylosporangium aurantiacum]MDG6102760.1 aldehyde dehydrogenase family protein [Dactylosporangium aurantiacum]UWZ52997.1 aldehyde dehydrogenase family protein [Dactylosporangium aurantiacum]
MIDVYNPATEQVIGAVPETADVDPAVAAARAAFGPWSALPRAARAAHLAALRDLLAAHADELAALITAEMGAPLTVSRKVQVGLPIAVLSSMVDLLAGDEPEERIGNSLVVRDPVGVVAAITPWNYPLHQTVAKLAPALAAGNTVVHKPSEVAPLSALRLHELVREAGLPDGVYNLVTGYGDPTGAALAGHPGVDLVSFTGSTGAGRTVAALAARNLTRVSLELGGKSANVVLPDADLAAAVKVGVGNCFLNSGQTCTAWTRLLVHESQHDEAVGLAVAAASRYTVGDPTDPATRLGPLASAAQRDRVLSYVERGRAGGAKVANEPGSVPDVGYYVAPVVFADVDPMSVIAQEEIFGPVLSIIRYRDEDDAVRIANGTPYGLAGSVWSGSPERALAVARRLRTGQVDVNGASFNPLAPFGGIGDSGYGRELGVHGYEEFTSVKAVQL